MITNACRMAINSDERCRKLLDEAFAYFSFLSRDEDVPPEQCFILALPTSLLVSDRTSPVDPSHAEP